MAYKTGSRQALLKGAYFETFKDDSDSKDVYDILSAFDSM
jgi:hypothetical protein